MLKTVIGLLALLLTLPALALERVSPEGAAIVVYQVEEEYADVKELLQMAIIGQGLVITNTLHISEMYQRTAADLGLEDALYAQAEAFEFCSIMLSYRMSQAHPGNLAVCPLTIGFYQPSGESQVYVSYRTTALLGDGAEAEAELAALLDGIVREALE